jgi:hypothetical protein
MGENKIYNFSERGYKKSRKEEDILHSQFSETVIMNWLMKHSAT